MIGLKDLSNKSSMIHFVLIKCPKPENLTSLPSRYSRQQQAFCSITAVRSTVHSHRFSTNQSHSILLRFSIGAMISAPFSAVKVAASRGLSPRSSFASSASLATGATGTEERFPLLQVKEGKDLICWGSE